MEKTIEGIIVPILTPITEEETPCLLQLKELTNYVIAGGVNAIFANGTTGEFARFSKGLPISAERRKPGRMP